VAASLDIHPLLASAWGGDIYIDAKNSNRSRNWVDYTFKRADKIITTSKTLRKFILKNYDVQPERIMSFYWGQDLELYKIGYTSEVKKLRKQLGISDDDFVILSSRNMRPPYGIHYIVKAIPEVLKKKKNVKFIFLAGLGFEDYINEIKSQIKDMNAEKNTIFISKFLSQKELVVYNNLADAVISLPVSDQLSNAIKEGMACGAVPIIRDLEVYHELIKDGKNGFLVNREDTTEVAKRIIYCIDNHPELKNKMARLNREKLEAESDWNKNKKLMLKIYLEILNHSK
jgi:glycosyltransferase involved in cell wall biosynthesis